MSVFIQLASGKITETYTLKKIFVKPHSGVRSFQICAPNAIMSVLENCNVFLEE
jgi:hypothetical protein